MCGRFVSSTPVSKLVEQFLVEEVKVEEHDASYNVAPTTEIMAVAASAEGVRRLGTFKWGLVPTWAKDPSIGNRMINLRAETVSEKPSFRRTLAKHRCIIPADGFYEWKDMGKGRKKQPFLIRARDGTVLAFAGLWEAWKDKDAADDEWLRTCTIITTEPNKLLEPIHNRMPVVLPPEAWDTWLDRENTDADDLTTLLKPAPDDLLELFPVSTAVNSVANDGEELVLPLEGHEP
ncbi:MAG TPA: SOS response-associated peptidase [Acidimicrobiales bacterium]|nr:SOS response-associated peptidase [Acidimicrobiales bacterium]